MTARSSSAHFSAVALASTPFVFINFALPVYIDELGLGAVQLGFLYTAFMGTMLLFRPVVGWCLDRLGRRWFFTAAFVFYAGSMWAFAHGLDFPGLMLARTLQGIGASLMWVAARTIIADTTPESGRGEAMGRLSAGSVRGSIIGSFWGFTLLANLPLIEAWRIGFSGYALMALTALVWSLFKVDETHHVPDARPPRGMRFTPQLYRVFIIVFVSALASSLIEPIYLLFLRHKFDLHPLLLAAAFLPVGLVFAIVPRYAGAWADRVGRRRAIAIGVAAAGIVSLALPWWPHILFVAVTYLLFAVGWAIASPAQEALVADLAPEAARGRVIGAKEAAAGVGAALGPLVGGVIYEHAAPEAAFVLNGVLLLLCAVLAIRWLAPRRSCGLPLE